MDSPQLIAAPLTEAVMPQGVSGNGALAAPVERVADIVPSFGGLLAMDTAVTRPVPAPSPRLAYDLAAASVGAQVTVSTQQRHTGRLAALGTLGALQTAAAAPRASVMPKPAFGPDKNAFDGDFLIVAAGAVLLPSYEGADETSVMPGVAFAGKFRGIGISPRAAGFALNLVPQKAVTRVSFNLGPVLRLRMNRAGRVKDPVVMSLGKLKPVIEGGVSVGMTVKRLINPHDQLSLGGDFRWDISGKGGGGIISPSASYLTPVSKAQVIGLLASAEFANKRFASYNYSISPAGSAASGLPLFTANGGLKAINMGAFTARDLDGTLLNGGLSVGAGAMFSRLKGSAAKTPITAQRGKTGQWVFALGLGYTF